jgi:hypothetical protein
MRARTPTSLPKGITMDYYDTPRRFRVGRSERVVEHKWQAELEKAKKWLEQGETVVQVPEGTTQINWANQLRVFLGKDGALPTICKIGDTELYVRLTGE